MIKKDKTIKEYIRESMLKQQDEAKIVRKVIMIMALVLIVIVICVGLGGYFYVQSALKPADPDNQSVQTVEIPIGSSIGTISSILEEKGIIKNAKIFKYYTKFKNEAGFQAGNYELTPAMTLPEITNSLKTGKVVLEATLKITIPEGKQLVQISTIIGDKIGQDPDAVFKQLNDKKFIEKMQALYPNLLTDEIYAESIRYPLEGYLFPATYGFFEEEPSVETVVIDMLKQTEKVLNPYQEEMDKKDFTNHKLLTLSSLIEEEATAKVDRDKISSVFYNRIKADMPLQTDPTILYAKGEHQNKVYTKDIEVQSPYNTYKNKGLTPGPIANAGKMSIEAALRPAETEYYYFLAADTGEVYFSVTLEEHNEKKAKYITDKK